MPITRREFLSYSALSLGALSLPAVSKTHTSATIPLQLRDAEYDWFNTDIDPVRVWEFSKTSLRLQQYQPVTITVENQLSEPSSVHWHGMRVNNAMDGVSGLTQAPIQPKQDFSYQVPTEDAGTFWAHTHHKTFEQLAKGLYMPVIVEEANPYSVDKDLLFVVDDWRLNRVGQIDESSFGTMHDWSHSGRMGNVVTINRRPQEQLNVHAGDRVRLRVLNAANARIFNLLFEGLSITIIAKDGQPLEIPVPIKDTLAIGPAERYDLIIDIPPNWSGKYAIKAMERRQNFMVAQWQVNPKVSKLPAISRPIRPLAKNPLPEKNFKVQHELTLDMSGGAMGNLQAAFYKGDKLSVNELIAEKQVWTFNGVANLPEQALIKIKVGDGVSLTIENNTRWPHAMHLHGHHFIANNTTIGNEVWQDTVLMKGNEKTTLRFQAERPGKWLFHCHMIEHQASGMVTWIEVLV